MDVADLIESFRTATYSETVFRRSQSVFVRGRASESPPSTFPIVASVQPATGRDLKLLPELRRSVETRVVYTATKLVTAEQDGAQEADRLTFDGREWEVQHVETWDGGAAETVTHYRCLVQAQG